MQRIAVPLKSNFFASEFSDVLPTPAVQTTLSREATFSGVGLFTGEKSSIRIRPTAADTGIIFQRTDLPGRPEIPARLAFVKEAPRCTRLATSQASILMVEHLLSALYALGVDNALIEVAGPEIPAGDGSSKPFVEILIDAGLQKLEAPRRFIRVETPLYWSEGEIHLVALPALEFSISYTLHYPNSPLLRSQYFSFNVDPDLYRTEIAPCRTFSLYDEIIPFIEKGIIKGGGLQNALVIQGDKILNPEGARFPDEMVRHKVLDLIGDLALIGRPIFGHILAIRSGHASNVAFAKVLSKSLNLEYSHG